MLLALPVAALAGLVSFFSPCVLPLLPGYLSFATGLGATEITAARGHRGRLLAGTALFVAGFAVVFVSAGVLAGSFGRALLIWQRPITIVIGVLTILLGLVFTGWLPFAQGSARLNVVPRFGLASAPLLGVVFGLGWTPCIGPALGVVLNLALNEATALRGGILALVYALGLGIPFVVAGLALEKLARTIGWVKRHHLAVQRTGGVLMILVGLLLVTGWWDTAVGTMRQWASAFEVPI
ncbi:MAG: cytochrome c biogenesis protein CcdA [Propionicimonas sp.]|nr:cytochrome c biogenesis protein CcdA [Propionicimonas sp.]MEA4944925.1 cytochrome c biogenesis protein CcdA [Propionicimonas sp.]MEA5055822.1 cytochrome c biogenesis protein CcdA [Propionicimonas sp.]MEA5117924.1 cytochrome c biogenesis protein CcdA [Propionicimonas sp.]